MKQLYVVAIISLIWLSACNKVQKKAGVVFSEKSYEAVVEEAGKTGKMIFMDFYADW